MKKKLQRKATVKKTVKEEKKTKQEIKNELILNGSAELLPKPLVPGGDSDNELIINCARVLGISTLGVTIIEGSPYINKLGRKEKLEQYLGQDGHKYRIDYEWIQMSKNDIDKAVCQAFFVDSESGAQVSSKIIGECSPATVKQLAGYQNHQAQTRAHNRLIEEVFGVRIHEEMVQNIAILKKEGKISNIPVINTTVSAEEVELPKNEPGNNGQKCESCGKSVTNAEANFSKRIYKKVLCRTCQPARKTAAVAKK